MTQQMIATLIVVLLFAVLIAAMFFIPRFLMKRAARKVVKAFRKDEVTSPVNAKALEELGLAPKSPFSLDRAFRLRDYRPMAVRLLGQANVVKTTAEGKVYLDEEELERSPVKTFIGLE